MFYPLKPASLVRRVVALLLPVLIAVVEARTTDGIRTVDVTLSRFAFSPQRIEARVGEPIRLNVVSTDGTHGFQVKALRLNVRVPAGGTVATLDLTPAEAGTFRINCSEYCGSGHGQMEAWLIVSPAT